MQCPVCKTARLEIVELEPGLKAHGCPRCGGHFLDLVRYLDWVARQGSTPTPPPVTSLIVPIADSSPGKLCPSCGAFLIRYQIGHGVGFALDRCRCGGIWLDRDEWAALKARGLHDEIHRVASEPWQNEVKSQERQEAFRQTVQAALDGKLAQEVGDADLKLVKEFTRWLEDHPARKAVFGYLQAMIDL